MTQEITLTPSTRPRPPLKDGWNPKLLSLRLSKKYPRLSKAVIKWEMMRAPYEDGPPDLSDLLAPGQDRPADIPSYYMFKPVHGMKGLHWMHRSMGYRLERMAEDFPFGRYDQVKWWVQSQVLDAGVKPKKILEVGAGIGSTAFVYAEVFPDAEIICVDISPSMLRWGKKLAREKGFDNIKFYHMDAGELSYFEDDTFDVVHESHMFHENPSYQIMKALREMVRVAKPGGLLGFFDWAVPEEGDEKDWRLRKLLVRIGQEPFMMDFATTNHPERLKELGCLHVERTVRHSYSAAWRAFKGPESNAILARTAADARTPHTTAN